METKVLAGIMKLQAAQIILTNEGIHNSISVVNSKYGSLELTAYVRNTTDEKIASDILETYKFKGADIYSTTHNEGTESEFKTIVINAFITDMK